MSESTNRKPVLETLSDVVTDAHARIQKDFSYINPVVGLTQKLRDIGIPADTMTIDCLRTNHRIIIVLHDEQPGVLSYQFTRRDCDPALEFMVLPIAELSSDVIYGWIASSFSKKN
ncbi:MAG: hypothetical protein ACI93R_001737 [Flavobacteriales bacterium]